jgi:hypothetical protein
MERALPDFIFERTQQQKGVLVGKVEFSHRKKSQMALFEWR